VENDLGYLVTGILVISIFVVGNFLFMIETVPADPGLDRPGTVSRPEKAGLQLKQTALHPLADILNFSHLRHLWVSVGAIMNNLCHINTSTETC